jgi:hypothetical protein
LNVGVVVDEIANVAALEIIVHDAFNETAQ